LCISHSSATSGYAFSHLTRNIGERYKADQIGEGLCDLLRKTRIKSFENPVLWRQQFSQAPARPGPVHDAPYPFPGAGALLLVKSVGSNPISCSSRGEAYDKWLQIATKTISFLTKLLRRGKNSKRVEWVDAGPFEDGARSTAAKVRLLVFDHLPIVIPSEALKGMSSNRETKYRTKAGQIMQRPRKRKRE
jgi:hypothetical protein